SERVEGREQVLGLGDRVRILDEVLRPRPTEPEEIAREPCAKALQIVERAADGGLRAELEDISVRGLGLGRAEDWRRPREQKGKKGRTRCHGDPLRLGDTPRARERFRGPNEEGGGAAPGPAPTSRPPRSCPRAWPGRGRHRLFPPALSSRGR